MEIPYTVEARPDTGLSNGKFGVWLFLASEVMLFAALFSSYILLRVGSTEWPHGYEELSVPMAFFNTVVLITSSVTMVMAWASLKMNDFGKFRLYLGLTILLSFVFLVVKYFEYSHHLHAGEGPWHNTYYAIYFTITGLHGLHILGGIIVNTLFAGAGREDVADGEGAVYQPHRDCRSLLALRRPGVDLPVPGSVSVVMADLKVGTTKAWGHSCSRSARLQASLLED